MVEARAGAPVGASVGVRTRGEEPTMAKRERLSSPLVASVGM